MRKKKTTNNSFRSLEELNRTITVLPKAKDWPSSTLTEKLEAHLQFLNSFSNGVINNEDLSEERIKHLQKLLDSFFEDKRHRIQNITESNKNNILKILYNSNKLFVNGKELCSIENSVNMQLLISKIDKAFYPKIIKPLMQIFLTEKYHTKGYYELLNSINEKITKDSPEFIYDLNLYYYDQQLLSSLKMSYIRNYFKNLSNHGIRGEYIRTEYFLSLFKEWIIDLNGYDFELLQENKTLLDTCTVDDCKIIFANVIIYIYKAKRTDDAHSIITSIQEQIFPSLQGDPTEKSYWVVADPKYQRKIFEDELAEACRIMNIFLSRDIISKFFDFMGNQDDSTTVERSNFWRPYCESKQFENINIVLTNSQKNMLYENLKGTEQISFNRHLVRNISSGRNESPALIISFKDKTIIEFTYNGNATQVVDTNSAFLKSILDYGKVANTKELKLYSNHSVFTNTSGVGTITHFVGWTYKTKNFLRRYNIYDGND